LEELYAKSKREQNRDTMKEHCLNCKYYQIHETTSGFCRVEILTAKGSGCKKKNKPLVEAEHTCERWKNCGQTYYIRLGWIKNKEKEMLA